MTLGSYDKDQLRVQARRSGDPYKGGAYFNEAEPEMRFQWDLYIEPMIKNCDFSVTLDLAAGHGRNSAILLERAERLIIVDINEECIDFCKQRFGDNAKISYVVNDGVSLRGVADNSVTLLYCFDSMVHFDSDVVRSYLAEAFRVLKPGGTGFIHHSNYDANPTGSVDDNPHWRNFMSKALFAHWCAREGLTVLEQRVIDWGLHRDGIQVIKADNPALDCLTLFQKPVNAPAHDVPVDSNLLRRAYHALVPVKTRLRLREVRKRWLG